MTPVHIWAASSLFSAVAVTMPEMAQDLSRFGRMCDSGLDATSRSSTTLCLVGTELLQENLPLRKLRQVPTSGSSQLELRRSLGWILTLLLPVSHPIIVHIIPEAPLETSPGSPKNTTRHIMHGSGGRLRMSQLTVSPRPTLGTCGHLQSCRPLELTASVYTSWRPVALPFLSSTRTTSAKGQETLRSKSRQRRRLTKNSRTYAHEMSCLAVSSSSL
jgi:hypothetical protein